MLRNNQLKNRPIGDIEQGINTEIVTPSSNKRSFNDFSLRDQAAIVLFIAVESATSVLIASFIPWGTTLLGAILLRYKDPEVMMSVSSVTSVSPALPDALIMSAYGLGLLWFMQNQVALKSSFKLDSAKGQLANIALAIGCSVASRVISQHIYGEEDDNINYLQLVKASALGMGLFATGLTLQCRATNSRNKEREDTLNTTGQPLHV